MMTNTKILEEALSGAKENLEYIESIKKVNNEEAAHAILLFAKKMAHVYVDTISSYIQEIKMNNELTPHIIMDWEKYKKTNWFESDAIDVTKKLMDDFISIHTNTK